MSDYEKMLEQGLKSLPESNSNGERFEMPKVKGHIEGNKTILTNFSQIASILHRESDHILKFLLKELATPGVFREKRLVLGRKISSKQINEKIEKYARIYVLCKDCQKPDTQLLREDKILMLKCTACGAKHPVRI